MNDTGDDRYNALRKQPGNFARELDTYIALSITLRTMLPTDNDYQNTLDNKYAYGRLLQGRGILAGAKLDRFLEHTFFTQRTPMFTPAPSVANSETHSLSSSPK